MNKETKHYILGLLSGLLFVPIVEELLNVIMAWIQVLILKPNKIVLQGNKELAELQNDDVEDEQTNCIGFQIFDEDEYYEEDE